MQETEEIAAVQETQVTAVEQEVVVVVGVGVGVMEEGKGAERASTPWSPPDCPRGGRPPALCWGLWPRPKW